MAVRCEEFDEHGALPFPALGDLQRALGVPSSPAHRRGVLLNRLKALAAAGQVRLQTAQRPWYELRK